MIHTLLVAFLALLSIPVAAGLLLLSIVLAWAGPAPLRTVFRHRSAVSPPVLPRSAIDCGAAPDGRMNLGFRIQTFSSGLRAAVWYPTTAAETGFKYPGGLASSVALDASVAECEQYPLIVFSHGFKGCSVQSVFFTEELARSGYIVVAPDHKDSVCKVDQRRSGNVLLRPEQPFFRPLKWTDATYRYRAKDLKVVLDEILRDPKFGPRIDPSRIGGAGHSLGGYTILGVSGGWTSWKDDRIKAALLMSPFLMPYFRGGKLPSVHVPLMYQGGTGDFTLTPVLRRSGGVYDATNRPKYFVEFTGAHHLDWSNFTCGSHRSIPACLEHSKSARLMNAYALAFFNRYLKGRAEPLLDHASSEVTEYRHAE